MTELRGINTTCYVCGNDLDSLEHRLNCPNSPHGHEASERELRVSLQCPTCGSENQKHWYETFDEMDILGDCSDTITIECWGCGRTLLDIDGDSWFVHKWGVANPWEGIIQIEYDDDIEMEWCGPSRHQREEIIKFNE